MVDGVNLYEYVKGNPVRLRDPDGMEGKEGGENRSNASEAIEEAETVTEQDSRESAHEQCTVDERSNLFGDMPRNNAAEQIEQEIRQEAYAREQGSIEALTAEEYLAHPSHMRDFVSDVPVGGVYGLGDGLFGILGSEGHHVPGATVMPAPETPGEELGYMIGSLGGFLVPYTPRGYRNAHRRYNFDLTPAHRNVAGRFGNSVRGRTVRELEDLVPPNASVTRKGSEHWEWSWEIPIGPDAGTKRASLRVHSARESAPQGSNSAQGWTARIEVGGQSMDPMGRWHPSDGVVNPRSPFYDERVENEIHIPIGSPEAGWTPRRFDN